MYRLLMCLSLLAALVIVSADAMDKSQKLSNDEIQFLYYLKSTKNQTLVATVVATLGLANSQSNGNVIADSISLTIGTIAGIWAGFSFLWYCLFKWAEWHGANVSRGKAL